MKKIFIITICLLSQGCTSENNQLIGKWEFYGDRTRSELEQRSDTPEEVLLCYKKKACGYNTSITYTKSTWTSELNLSTEGKHETEPVEYTVVKNKGNEIEISTRISGVDQSYKVYFVDKTLSYVFVEKDGFRWKDYFRKIH